MISKSALAGLAFAATLGSAAGFSVVVAHASEHHGHGSSALRASAGGETGDNSPGSPSGSPGSTVTNCRTGSRKQHGLVNVGIGNVCGVGVLNGLLANSVDGLLTSSGHSTGGLLNANDHSNGGLLSGLLGD